MRAIHLIEEIQGEGRGKILIIIAVGSGLMMGAQMIYPVILPQMRAEFGFNLSTSGLLLTILWLSNATGQLPGGVLGDKIGDGSTLILSIVLTILSLITFLLINSEISLFISTFLLGFAIAIYGVSRYTALDDLFPNKLGTTVGIVQATSDAGQAILPPLAGLIAVSIAWQFGLGFLIPLLVGIFLSLIIYMPLRLSAKNEVKLLDTRYIVNLTNSITRSPIAYGTGVLFAYGAIWAGFTSFYPIYLIEIKGLSQPVAAVLYGLFFSSGIFTKLSSGLLYDRAGMRYTILPIAGTSAIGLLLLPFMNDLMFLVVITIMISPILGCGTVAQSHIINELPTELRGTGLGTIRTGVMTIASFMPALIGIIAENGYFDYAFHLLFFIAFFIFIFSLLKS